MNDYMDDWIENLILENKKLYRQNKQLKIDLEESEKKYSDYLNQILSAGSVTDAWVREILNGNVVIGIN